MPRVVIKRADALAPNDVIARHNGAAGLDYRATIERRVWEADGMVCYKLVGSPDVVTLPLHEQVAVVVGERLEPEPETVVLIGALERALKMLKDPQPGVWSWYESAGRVLRETRDEITKLLEGK